MENWFYIIFLITVLTTRAFLYAWPIAGPTAANFRVHHYMYGLVGITIGAVFQSAAVYAIGLGLFVDELAYLLIGGHSHEDNYSAASLFGTLVFLAAVFVLRAHLLRLVMR